MYWKINIFPNESNEKLVAFSLHIQAEAENDLEDYELRLSGYIPASDSVTDLRSRAGAQAAKILKALAAKALPATA